MTNRETVLRGITAYNQHQFGEWEVKWTAVQMLRDKLCARTVGQKKKKILRKGISEVRRKTNCTTMKLVAGICTHCGQANNKNIKSASIPCNKKLKSNDLLLISQA